MEKKMIDLILEKPGIAPEDIAKLFEITVRAARRHLSNTLKHYPCLKIRNNRSNTLEVFLLERKKGSHSPYKYSYKKIKSIEMIV